jgi:hypothetical protein
MTSRGSILTVRHFVAALVTGLAAGLVAVPAAVAAPAATLTAVPSHTPWGRQVGFTGFAAGETIALTFSAGLSGPATATASASGTGTIPVTVSPVANVLTGTIRADGQTSHTQASLAFPIAAARLTAGHSVTVTPTASSAADTPYLLATPTSQFSLQMTSGRLLIWSILASPSGSNYAEWISPNARYAGSGRLVMQGDGNLVLYGGQGQALWSAGTNGTGSANQVVLQGDGNLVVYTATGTAVWSSRTGRIPVPRRSTVTSGQVLTPGQALYGGAYHAVVQGDGNFVVYGKRVWSSRTSGQKVTDLQLLGSGNLVLFGPSYRQLWSSGTSIGADAATLTRLVMQSDGNLVLYNESGKALWNSATY